MMRKIILTLLLLSVTIYSSAQPVEVGRGEFHKTFKNDDGSYTQEICIDPLHYKENNQWKNIDINIDENLEVKKAPFFVKFPEYFDGKFIFEVEGERIEFEPEENIKEHIKGKVKDNTITYTLFDSIKVKYLVTNTGVRKEVIVDEVDKKNKIEFKKEHINKKNKIKTRPSPIYLNFVDDKNVIGQFNTDVTLQPDDGIDANMAEGASDTNYGAYNRLYVSPNESDNHYRSLLKFDVSSIPATATVSAATLSLYCLELKDAGVNDVYISGRILIDWGEGDNNNTAADAGECSWNSAKHGSVTWTTAGCGSDGNDYNASVEGQNTSVVASQFNAITLSDLTSLQGWIDGNITNYGWRLHGDETEDTTDNSVVFYSSDQGNETTDPKLAVTYTVPAEPQVIIVTIL